MDLEAIKAYFEENKESDDVKTYLQGLAPASELKLEDIQKHLDENEEVKTKVLQPKLDKHFTTSLETWKKNNIEKIVTEEMTKRGLVEDETAKTIRELKEQIEETNRKAVASELRAKAKDIASDKKLPLDLVEFFVGADEETTLKNIGNFEAKWTSALNAEIESRLKSESGRDPFKPKDNAGGFTLDDVMKMSEAEVKANWDKIKHLK